VKFSALAAVVALLGAGCSESSPDPDGPAEPEDSPRESSHGYGTGLSINGSTSTTVTFAKVPSVSVGLEGNNCIVVRESIDAIHSGHIEVTWDDSIPAYAQLQLAVLKESVKTVQGAPPLRLDLSGTEPSSAGYWFALQPLFSTGALVRLPMTLTWSFDEYDGLISPRFEPSSCGID
jgi:hypothetical protein